MENFSYRVHRLATVATQLAKLRCPTRYGRCFSLGGDQCRLAILNYLIEYEYEYSIVNSDKTAEH